MISKINKPLATLTKKKRKRTQSQRRGNIVPYTIQTQRIIKNYYKQLYLKLENIEEINKLLKHTTYQDWVKGRVSQNIPVMSKQIESQIKNHSTKVKDQMASLVNSTRHVRRI